MDSLGLTDGGGDIGVQACQAAWAFRVVKIENCDPVRQQQQPYARTNEAAGGTVLSNAQAVSRRVRWRLRREAFLVDSSDERRLTKQQEPQARTTEQCMLPNDVLPAVKDSRKSLMQPSC